MLCHLSSTMTHYMELHERLTCPNLILVPWCPKSVWSGHYSSGSQTFFLSWRALQAAKTCLQSCQPNSFRCTVSIWFFRSAHVRLSQNVLRTWPSTFSELYLLWQIFPSLAVTVANSNSCTLEKLMRRKACCITMATSNHELPSAADVNCWIKMLPLSF